MSYLRRPLSKADLGKIPPEGYASTEAIGEISCPSLWLWTTGEGCGNWFMLLRLF